MPFLLPLLPAIIPGLLTGGAAVAGAVEGAQAGGRQQRALSQQEQIAAQEMADKQKIFDLLQPFFQQYLGAGSPFLSQIQRASAEQNAQQFSNAAGQVRNTMQTSGLGFGPSGATAAAIGGLGGEAARASSSDYLTNLLNNEQLKFQAAQGLNTIGSMAGASQNQPNVGVTLQPQSTASGIFGLSQALGGLLGGGSSNPFPGGGPYGNPSPTFPTNQPLAPPTPPIIPPTNFPSTSGFGLGPSG